MHNNLNHQPKRPRQYSDEIVLLSKCQRQAALEHVPQHLQGMVKQHIDTYEHLIEEPMIKRLVNELHALHQPFLIRNRLYTIQQSHPALYDRVAMHFKGVS